MKRTDHNLAPPDSLPFRGPLDWRTLVDWLEADGVISPEEAERTVARCSVAHSVQPPLQRLGVVG
ncbi:MAG: hypothetical protein U1D28_07860, partial [Burkholderiales bacterium]|nr:hypothetical protein [Burkholderiales bacterium]